MAAHMILRVASAPDLRKVVSDSEDDSDSSYDHKERKKKKSRPISRMSANNLDAMRRQAEVESVVPRGIVQNLNRLSLITNSEKVIVKHAPPSPPGFARKLSEVKEEESHEKSKRPCFPRVSSAPSSGVVVLDQPLTRSPSLIYIDASPDSPPCHIVLPPCSAPAPEEFSLHYINDDDANSLSPEEDDRPSLPNTPRFSSYQIPSPKNHFSSYQIPSPRNGERSLSGDIGCSPCKTSEIFRFRSPSDAGAERSSGKEIESSVSDLMSDSGVTRGGPGGTKRRTTSLRLQIASDLHMEMFDRDPYTPAALLRERVIKPICKFLALVGDIGCPAEEEGYQVYKEFLLHQASQFEKVFVLAGNHEYYNNGLRADRRLSVNEIKQRIQGICDLNDRLVFLDRKSVVVNGVRVAGCTLWSAIHSESRKIVQQSVNDYHLCYVENVPNVSASPSLYTTSSSTSEEVSASVSSSSSGCCGPRRFSTSSPLLPAASSSSSSSSSDFCLPSSHLPLASSRPVSTKLKSLLETPTFSPFASFSTTTSSSFATAATVTTTTSASSFTNENHTNSSGSFSFRVSPPTSSSSSPCSASSSRAQSPCQTSAYYLSLSSSRLTEATTTAAQTITTTTTAAAALSPPPSHLEGNGFPLPALNADHCSSCPISPPFPSATDSRLRRLTARDTNRWHREEVAFLHREALEAKRLDQKLLILTHHPPTFRNTSNPHFADSPIRVAFASDLEYMLDWRGNSDFSAVHTWVSGHTHWSSDQLINGTHVVSNQYGYSGSSDCIYKPGFVISV